MGFPRQEILEWWPFPSPGDLPLGDEPGSLTLQADSLLSEPPGILSACEVLHVIVGTSKWQLQTYCKRCVLKMYSIPPTFRKLI